jgi:hypothetical protein
MSTQRIESDAAVRAGRKRTATYAWGDGTDHIDVQTLHADDMSLLATLARHNQPALFEIIRARWEHKKEMAALQLEAIKAKASADMVVAESEATIAKIKRDTEHEIKRMRNKALRRNFISLFHMLKARLITADTARWAIEHVNQFPDAKLVPKAVSPKTGLVRGFQNDIRFNGHTDIVFLSGHLNEKAQRETANIKQQDSPLSPPDEEDATRAVIQPIDLKIDQSTTEKRWPSDYFATHAETHRLPTGQRMTMNNILKVAGVYKQMYRMGLQYEPRQFVLNVVKTSSLKGIRHERNGQPALYSTDDIDTILQTVDAICCYSYPDKFVQ